MSVARIAARSPPLSEPANSQFLRPNASPRIARSAALLSIESTTNAIEALNSKLRRSIRARGHFPLNRAAEDWKWLPREWCEAKTQFAVMFGERFVNG
jgi:putative transposase